MSRLSPPARLRSLFGNLRTIPILGRFIPFLPRRISSLAVCCFLAIVGLSQVRAAVFSDLQISDANLPSDATFKLQQDVPWGFTIENKDSTPYANAGGANVFVAYIKGTDVYGNLFYIEVARGAIPAIGADKDVKIDNRKWTVPNDGTLFNTEGPGYSFVVSIFSTAPTTLASLSTTAANPFLSSSGNFFIDVIPDLAVAAPGVTYRPGEYRGGDVVRFATSWGNRTVGEDTLSSRPLRPRDLYPVSLHLSENGAFYSGASPTPSPSPSPSPTPSDPDSALGATDSVNDDFKLMAIIFSGDLAGILPDGSDQFRRVQVVGTPPGTGTWPAAGSMKGRPTQIEPRPLVIPWPMRHWSGSPVE
jgi:hypothetical protein